MQAKISSPTKLFCSIVLLLIGATCSTLATAQWQSTSPTRSGFYANVDEIDVPNSEAPFFYMHDGLRVYFGREGLTYTFVVGVKHKVESDEHEGQAAYEHHHRELLTPRFTMAFTDPNAACEIALSDSLAGYMVQRNNQKTQRFATLTMSNVWENIDIVYQVDARGGFNYTIVLHPGSDLSDVRFDYRNADQLTATVAGLVVSTGLGTWMESAPKGFTAHDAPIDVDYAVAGSMVSFQMEGYTSGMACRIDPWVTFFPAYDSYDELPAPMDSVWFGLGDQLTGTGINNAFNRVQMDCDSLGNVYIARTPALFYTSGLGVNGYYPAGRFVEKYDQSGNLVYIFNNGYEEGYFSDITVNKTNEQVYFTSLASEINYLDADGSVINVVAVTDLPFDVTEVCSLEFDHCTNRVILGFGGDFAQTPSFYGYTDAANSGAVAIFDGYDVSTSIPEFLPYNDNIDLVIDPVSGDYFFLFLLRSNFVNFFADRALLKVNPVDMEPLVQTSGDFLNFTELGMHSSGQLTFFRNHFNALGCGRNAVYGTNGSQLVRWDKQSGALLNSVSLPGFVEARAEGIDVDLSERVYIGSNNQIRVYDAGLGFLQNIPLQGMPQDIAVFGNKLYVATDFALQSIDLVDNLVPWSLSQVPDSCNACVGEASISFGDAGLPADVSIEWLASGSTELTQTNLCAGWHTVMIRELKNCVEYAYLDSVLVETNDDAVCGFEIALNDVAVCEGECITITPEVSGQEGQVTFQWSTGLVTTEPELEFCIDQTTMYQLIAFDAEGAIDTAMFTLTVVPFPVLELGNDTTLCAGSSLLLDAQNPGALYLWQDGSTAQNFEVSSTGTYTVAVSQGNCVTTDALVVAYSQVDFDLGPNRVLCEGEEVTLTSGLTGGQHNWSNGASSFAIQVSNPGSYMLTVSDDYCTVTDSVDVRLSSVEASFEFFQDDQCAPSSLAFLSTSTSEPDAISAWLWDFGDGTTSTLSSPDHVYTVAGVYSVSLLVTNAVGCSDDWVETDAIVVYPTPEADFTLDPSIPSTNEAIQFTDLSSDAVTWQWDFGDGGSSTESDPAYTYEAAGIYTITLSVENAFCSDVKTIQLALEEELLVYVPNAFTPNNDGLNDVFRPSLFGTAIDFYTFQVFNRWGNVIFETEDPNEAWVGNSSTFDETGGGFYVQDGAYAWRLVVREANSAESKLLTGHVIVIR